MYICIYKYIYIYIVPGNGIFKWRSVSTAAWSSCGVTEVRSYRRRV